MSEHYTDEHVLTTNGMGYFWCSCDGHRAHVLWSLNEHLVDIARAAEARGAERAVNALTAKVRAVSKGEPETWGLAAMVHEMAGEVLSVERAASEPETLAEQIAAAEQRGREVERERIAQAIEARRGTLHNAGSWEDLTIAARIAREGGAP